MEVERYIDNKGESWVRIKCMDAARTEIIIPENEFKKRYEKNN